MNIASISFGKLLCEIALLSLLYLMITVFS